MSTAARLQLKTTRAAGAAGAQVTYSLSTSFGVARQVVGEYQHFWTFRRAPGGRVRANLLTAACPPARASPRPRLPRCQVRRRR